jgi:hypothetical protein
VLGITLTYIRCTILLLLQRLVQLNSTAVAKQQKQSMYTAAVPLLCQQHNKTYRRHLTQHTLPARGMCECMQPPPTCNSAIAPGSTKPSSRLGLTAPGLLKPPGLLSPAKPPPEEPAVPAPPVAGRALALRTCVATFGGAGPKPKPEASLRPRPWAVRVFSPKPDAADREAALGSIFSPSCREETSNS